MAIDGEKLLAKETKRFANHWHAWIASLLGGPAEGRRAGGTRTKPVFLKSGAGMIREERREANGILSD